MGIRRGNCLPCSSPVGEELIVSAETGCVKRAGQENTTGGASQRSSWKPCAKCGALVRESKNLAAPPTNLYEYQRKRLTKIAFCKWLIPKDAFLVVLG